MEPEPEPKFEGGSGSITVKKPALEQTGSCFSICIVQLQIEIVHLLPELNDFPFYKTLNTILLLSYILLDKKEESK